MITEIAVVVPAANEELLIAPCVESLLVAAQELSRSTDGEVRSRLYIVLDDCHDATADILHRFVEVRVSTITERCVGTARAVGADRAIAEADDAAQLWIASTDADSQVPANWLTRMLVEADLGIDLLLGTVIPDGRLDPQLLAAWLREHDHGDGHPHVHGANLGIRATTLVAAGGWPRVLAHEDVQLVASAVAAGATVSRTAAIPVRTSTRMNGRAPHGFSSYLRELAAVIPLAG